MEGRRLVSSGLQSRGWAGQARLSEYRLGGGFNVGYADKVVDRKGHGRPSPVPGNSDEAELATSSDGLHPAKDLFNALAGTLAQLIAGVVRQLGWSRTSLPAVIPGDVRHDPTRS